MSLNKGHQQELAFQPQLIIENLSGKNLNERAGRWKKNASSYLWAVCLLICYSLANRRPIQPPQPCDAIFCLKASHGCSGRTYS